VSYAAALAVAHEIRQQVGNIDVMAKGCHGKTLVETQDLVAAKASQEAARFENALEADYVRNVVRESFEAIERAIEEDSEEWKAIVPGKPLLHAFASRANLHHARAKTLYIHAASTSGREPFRELTEIFASFAAE
jgi:HPt (histidine-containing phosphotransfer) domain-containing protein